MSNTAKYAPISEVHPVTGAAIEVFYADAALDTFGLRRAGWFWRTRRPGFSPDAPTVGPFPTSYSAYRNAVLRQLQQALPESEGNSNVNTDTVRTPTNGREHRYL
jgi:hypothetical protein